jgi:hypothetical protein
MSKITEFVAKAMSDTTNAHAEYIIGIVAPIQGQKIAQDLGIRTIAGAEKILTAHAVRHAFVRHAAKKSESERGQVGITEADFEYLADILSNPTSIEKGDDQHRKANDIIKFSKKVKGRIYTVLMSVTRTTERAKLFFNTMFIKA